MPADSASDQQEATRELVAQLQRGAGVTSIPPAFRLRADEEQYATLQNVTIQQFVAADVPYKTIHNRAAHPVGLIIHLTVHRAINKRRRERAELEAAPRWREIARGTLHVTSKRFVFDTVVEMYSWWYQQLIRAESDADGLVLVPEDAETSKFVVRNPSWLLVLFHFLAWGEVLDVSARHNK